MSCFNSVQRCRGALRNARAYDHAAPNAPKHAFLQLNAYVLYEGWEHVIWGLYVCQQAFQSDLHFCGGCSIHNADENERSLMNSEYFHKKSFSTRRIYTTVTFIRYLTFNWAQSIALHAHNTKYIFKRKKSRSIRFKIAIWSRIQGMLSVYVHWC